MRSLLLSLIIAICVAGCSAEPKATLPASHAGARAQPTFALTTITPAALEPADQTATARPPQRAPTPTPEPPTGTKETILAAPNPATTSSPIPIPIVGLSPAATATRQVARATANGNLRAGSSTLHPIIGSVTAHRALDLVARNPAGDWYELRSGAWIITRLVENALAVPVAAVVPTSPPPTWTPTPAATRDAGAGIAHLDDRCQQPAGARLLQDLLGRQGMREHMHRTKQDMPCRAGVRL